MGELSTLLNLTMVGPLLLQSRRAIVRVIGAGILGYHALQVMQQYQQKQNQQQTQPG